ncbi:MAG: preprotein translocase subunit SecG [Coprococcus sp.]
MMLKTIITVAYVVICIALIIIVLSQEGKEASLTNSITGGGYDNSYWSKNKGNSKEEVLKKITTVLGILFIGIALLLDSKLF